MNKFSDILSKPLLTIYEGELVGKVSSALADTQLRVIKYYVITTDSGEELYITPAHIFNVGINAVVIKNKDSLKSPSELQCTDTITVPLNCRIYTIDGEYLGKVTDLDIKNKSVITNLVIDENTKIASSRIASASKNSVIIMSENTTIRRSSFKRATPPKPAQHINKPLAESIVPEALIVEPRIIEVQKPTSIGFMLGKYCAKDIRGIGNEVIIRRGARISSQTINTASQHGKLKELMMNFN